MAEEDADLGTVGVLHKRRIIMTDGRYLVFFTFGEDSQREAGDSGSTSSSETSPQPSAEDTGV